MKPDTILEALIGKIAKDEDCVAANVGPETKLEKYISEIVKLSTPLMVKFSGTSDGGDAACSATFEEISEAVLHRRPIMATYYYEADDADYYLQLTERIGASGFLFSCVSFTPSGEGEEMGSIKVACAIDADGTVVISVDWPEK